MTTPTPLPYEGLRVVEFTHMVMGPTCGMVLADLGAEVIKVEPMGQGRHGDATRDLLGSGAGFFPMFNRNKKSLALDLQTPQGHEAVLRLIATADVVSENFKPGTMAKLGLDYASLKALNPRLVYVSHKGFLPGPYENRLALDEVVQNMAGLTYMTGPKGMPLRAGTSVNDIMGGMFGAIGVMAALRERDRTGQGQEIQSALFENCCLLAAQHMQQFQMSGEVPPPFPSRVSAWSVYNTFHVAHGEQLFIGAVSDKQFNTLCEVIGRQDLLTVAEFATNAQRVAVQPKLLAELQEAIQHFEIEDLCQQLEAAGLPYAKVVRPDQLVEDEHLLASGGLVPMQTDEGDSTKVVLLPLLLGGRRLGVRRPLPRVGEHTDEVLASLNSPSGMASTV